MIALLLEVNLYAGGACITPPGLRRLAHLDDGGAWETTLESREYSSWAWKLRLEEVAQLDDDWLGLSATLSDISGHVVGPRRPFLLYARPWIAPSVFAWVPTKSAPLPPEADGPVYVAALQVIGPTAPAPERAS